MFKAFDTLVVNSITVLEDWEDERKIKIDITETNDNLKKRRYNRLHMYCIYRKRNTSRVERYG